MGEHQVGKPAHRDDADARGEHVYKETPRPAPDRDPNAALTRKPGHYAAGANGVQDVDTCDPASAPDAAPLRRQDE